MTYKKCASCNCPLTKYLEQDMKEPRVMWYCPYCREAKIYEIVSRSNGNG